MRRRGAAFSCVCAGLLAAVCGGAAPLAARRPFLAAAARACPALLPLPLALPALATGGGTGGPATTTFADPNHPTGWRTLRADPGGAATIRGQDEPGSPVWTLAARITGDRVTVRLQDGSLAPPSGAQMEADEDGTLGLTFSGALRDDGILWADGNLWRKVTGAAARAD